MTHHEIDLDYEAWLDQQIDDCTAHQEAWAAEIEAALARSLEPIPLDWEEREAAAAARGSCEWCPKDGGGCSVCIPF